MDRLCRKKLHVMVDGKNCCMECKRIHAKEYYRKNLDKCKEFMRVRYGIKAKELNEKSRKYWKENRERLIKYQKDRYRNNSDKFKRIVNARARKNREYGVWNSMICRCHNPKDRSFKNYGARGIYVCERWRGSEGYSNFLNDMGKRPIGKMSIDRIDVNGPYSPQNCQWANTKQQARNQRRTIYIEYNGTKKSLAEWAEYIGIRYGVLRDRIYTLGWSVEKSIETPARVCVRI